MLFLQTRFILEVNEARKAGKRQWVRLMGGQIEVSEFQ
jgi:hypothetical protein